MKKVYDYVDNNMDKFINELLPFLAQPSISTRGVGLQECADMLEEIMKEIGIETEQIPCTHAPFVYGNIQVDPKKPRLLIYGHYDVQPPEPLEDWDNPPFEPIIKDNRIYARGAGDNKGQLFTSLKAVEAYRKTKGELPVNVSFIIDGAEEIGSPDFFDELMEKRPDIFDVDAFIFADGSTLEHWHPLIFYAGRGFLYLELTAKGSPLEWHSGTYGNTIINPALYLSHALASMRDRDGKILVEGFYDGALPIEDIDREVMNKIPFDAEKKLKELGIKEFWGDPSLSYYEKVFFHPSLTVCGLVSGYTEEGAKTVVPREAKAKLDITLVPFQDPKTIAARVREHLNHHGYNDIEMEILISCPPTKSDYDIPFGKIMANAIKKVWGKEPIIYPSIGGGGASVFHLGIAELGVPFAQPDLHEHSPNENLHLDWFNKGIKVFATLFEEFQAHPVAKRKYVKSK